MKGKHANVATARRDWVEIERERDLAVDRAERAESKLAEFCQSRTSETTELRREVKSLRTAVVDSTSTTVDELRQSVETLRRRLRASEAEIKQQAAAHSKFIMRVVGLIARLADVHPVVAAEMIQDGNGNGVKAVLNDTTVGRCVNSGKITTEQSLQIDRARHGKVRPPGLASTVRSVMHVDDPYGQSNLGPLTSDVARAASDYTQAGKAA